MYSIIQEVGTPDRNTLLPLLLVSRMFYDIATPILYQRISAVSIFKMSILTWGDQPSTYVFPQRGHLHQLYEVLTQKPALVELIESFVWHGKIFHSDAHEGGSVLKILPLLSRLRRLSAFPPLASVITIQPTHPNIHLTHFIYVPGWNRMVYDFIRSQPSLEFLALVGVSTGTARSVHSLPTVSLPNLKILNCRSCFFDNIDDSAPLEHLSIELMVTPRSRKTTPFKLLRNITTLACPAFMLSIFTAFCDRVEFLRITEMSGHTIEDVFKISPKTIQYLRFGPPKAYFPNIVAQIFFDEFPDLLVIDVTFTYESDRRYVRGSSRFKDLKSVDGRGFDSWHEAVLDDIKLEASEDEDW